ncbi:trigger factor-like protein TIG, Chloroplastic isoform X1 [Arachis hypogaea]|uniref:trigger factor-like protein TIG, Chloroplastic isoform X1 n=2 Tax=Arachis hypogaea TaxID=3818 RepID=UPI003B22035B
MSNHSLTSSSSSSVAASSTEEKMDRLPVELNVTETQEPNSRVRLQVEVPPVVCEDCYERVISEFTKQAKVPGFCPGKPVPESILVGYVGRKNFQKAIIESILRTLFYSHQSIPITTVTRFCASRASLESLSFGNTNANQNHRINKFETELREKEMMLLTYLMQIMKWSKIG